MPIFKFNVDNDGYIFLQRDFGDKQISQYLYADFSSDKNMGKLRLSDAQIINKTENDHD